MSETAWVKIYRVFLLMFPPSFRAEFSEEMLEVFSLAVYDSSNGSTSRFQIFMREFGGLAAAALKERLLQQEYKVNGGGTSAAGWEGALKGKELLVALGAFIIPGIGILLNTAAPSLLWLVLPLVLVFMGLVLLFGLMKGIPRWCLPYLGLALSMLSFFVVFNWIIDKYVATVIPLLGPGPMTLQTRILWEAFFSGMLWLGLFLTVILFLGLMAAVRRSRPFFYQLQQDWTAVSFIFYGGTMTALVLLFKDYRYDEPYALSSIFFLTAGAWIYLRSPYSWQRALALLSGLTLAMWVVAASKGVIVPQQNWVVWVQEYTAETERWLEIGLTLMQLGWMSLFLLLPRFLKFFHLPHEPARHGST
jgi:hypothetical protein